MDQQPEMASTPPDHAYAASGHVRRSRRPAAVVSLVAAGLLLVGAAGFAAGASPSPAASTNGTAGAAASGEPSPDASAGPKNGQGRGPLGLGPWGPGRFGVGGAFGRFGAFLGQIKITGIDGSKISLATEDGWTRTITVGESTTLMRAGQKIGLSDLKVGDQVRIAETKASDGSFTINRLDVILPTVAGEVTAKSGNEITLKLLGGATATVHVSGATTYRTRGKDSASLSDVSVGNVLVAVGTRRSDGSIDALQVQFGQLRAIEGRGRPFGAPKPKDAPGSSAAPSASGQTS